MPGTSPGMTAAVEGFLEKQKSDAGHGAAFSLGGKVGSYGLLSANFFEISAVWDGVPQLGASLPSPHLRGR
jgi:hypothetical protein